MLYGIQLWMIPHDMSCQYFVQADDAIQFNWTLLIENIKQIKQQIVLTHVQKNTSQMAEGKAINVGVEWICGQGPKTIAQAITKRSATAIARQMGDCIGFMTLSHQNTSKIVFWLRSTPSWYLKYPNYTNVYIVWSTIF